MKKINLEEKFSLFNDHWGPKVVGEMNGQQVKIAKVKGAVVWHDHANEEELFLIIKGTLKLVFENETVVLNEGEILIIPKESKQATSLLLLFRFLAQLSQEQRFSLNTRS